MFVDVLQVTNLKDHPHVVLERNTLITGQREHAVIVHHAVHRLDPIRVEVAVEDDPLVVAVLGYVCGLCPKVAHDHREHAVLPLTGREVDVPVPEEEGECTPYI